MAPPSKYQFRYVRHLSREATSLRLPPPPPHSSGNGPLYSLALFSRIACIFFWLIILYFNRKKKFRFCSRWFSHSDCLAFSDLDLSRIATLLSEFVFGSSLLYALFDVIKYKQVPEKSVRLCVVYAMLLLYEQSVRTFTC